MAGEIMFAVYKPREGKEMELKMALKRHVPTLRQQGYVTLRPPLFLKSAQDGTYIEIFQWVSLDAMKQAHDDEKVREVWSAIEAAAEIRTLADLEESKTPFPSFLPVQGVVCN
ncbi:MAG: hypothetical protein KJ042_04435 [Deltaproteobacteria bacterium]|nr:hypothetical protein [Deltaproteobacteria bacterium]